MLMADSKTVQDLVGSYHTKSELVYIPPQQASIPVSVVDPDPHGSAFLKVLPDPGGKKA